MICTATGGAFMKKSAITSGGASVIKDLIGTPTQREHPFVPTKGCKNGSGLRPKTRSPCCAGYGFRFFGYRSKTKSVLHADGLKKSLRRIFIAAALERRTANHHPCPLLKGGGTRGRINKYFKVDSLRLLQALTYPECRTAALHLPAHRAPFPPSGKGVGGKGRYARGYLGSDSVRSTD